MISVSRREIFRLGLAASAALGRGASAGPADALDVHRQFIDVASQYERQRRERFSAVATAAQLEALQQSLRETFLRLLGGLPERQGPTPPVSARGRVEGDDYVVEKLVFESLPGYFVPALLYRPKTADGPVPGVLSPCGHSAVGKAAEPYQVLHINLAKRGYAVLTYDPVGQGERSQFWDAERRRSRFNLVCGEHAALGNPLYLLGMNLARFRIWDGIRGIDYLASRPDVDAGRIGCVGNSGGGTLTAYIAALDRRVTAAAICCYITTLPRRMGNRIQEDPSADPEQDIFGFVSEGIDHAGLLALCAPRPTLLGTARFDFFPIKGARESFAEAQRLYEIAGARDRIARVEAAEKHGLSAPLRAAVYGWFDRWLAGRPDAPAPREVPVMPRPPGELSVCGGEPVNVALRSRPLLPLALEEFRRQTEPSKKPLREVLGLGPRGARPRVHELRAGAGALVVCISGSEAPDWQLERGLLDALAGAGCSVAVVDPRGAGSARPDVGSTRLSYSDPLSGIEENVAYNGFLVGQSLLALRVADVLAAVRQLAGAGAPRRTVLCARRDAALVACFAAALEPAVHAVATEELRTSFLPLFDAQAGPINAASILPGLLRGFGDVPDVLAQIAPRPVLVAAGVGSAVHAVPSVRITKERFTRDPRLLTTWLRD